MEIAVHFLTALVSFGMGYLIAYGVGYDKGKKIQNNDNDIVPQLKDEWIAWKKKAEKAEKEKRDVEDILADSFLEREELQQEIYDLKNKPNG